MWQYLVYVLSYLKPMPWWLNFIWEFSEKPTHLSHFRGMPAAADGVTRHFPMCQGNSVPESDSVCVEFVIDSWVVVWRACSSVEKKTPPLASFFYGETPCKNPHSFWRSRGKSLLFKNVKKFRSGKGEKRQVFRKVTPDTNFLLCQINAQMCKRYLTFVRNVVKTGSWASRPLWAVNRIAHMQANNK